MDPLSVTAGIVGLLGFAGVTLAKGYSVWRTLSESKDEVKKLLAELSQLTGILVAIEAQAKEVNRNVDEVDLQPELNSVSRILESLCVDCRKTLKKVWDILEKLEKCRRVVLLAKWQLLEPQVKTLIAEVEHYKDSFTLCLSLDVKKQTDDILELSKVISVQLLELKNDKEKDMIAAETERAYSNRRALLHWLLPRSDERHETAVKLRALGTCEWLIENDTFIAWLTGSESILWLNGIPGSGKTVLMSHVIEKLKTRISPSTRPIGVAYFYCTYTEAGKHQMPHVLCSLAAQLLRCFPQPENGPAMKAFKECDEGSLTPNSDKAQRLLVSLMNEMEAVFICLDALDECNFDEKNDLLQSIFVMIAECTNAKIIVSSRAGDTEISEFLDGSPIITITARAVAKDVDLYVRSRIDKGSKRLQLALTEPFVDKLTSGAEGMFLWASCQLDQLARLRTTADIHAAFKYLPRGLYRTYHNILENVATEHITHVSRALRWVAYAATPIKLDELVEAIAVIEGSSTSLKSLDKLIIPEDLFLMCGSLLRRSDITETLELAHTSVFEFLTDSESQSRSLGQFYMPSTESAVSLSKTCLTYLSFEDFQTDYLEGIPSSDLSEEWAVRASRNDSMIERPFFDYALRHWWKHLKKSGGEIHELWPYLIRFFDPQKGNHRTTVMLLNQLEGAYKYPPSMQPIHFCATHGISRLIPLLLENSLADIDNKVGDGRTALHMAVENNYISVVHELLDRGANVDSKTDDGRTPLQLALESADEPITQLLVAKGADVNCKFSSGDTPLTLVVGNNCNSLARYLLTEDADPNGCLFDGRAPLHVAAEIGSDPDIFMTLHDAGASIMLGDNHAWTPLHYAANMGNFEFALMLKGAAETSRLFEQIGWTPLHAAIQQEHINIVELFAEYAATTSKVFNTSRREQRLPSRSASIFSSGKMTGTAEVPPEPPLGGRQLTSPRLTSSREQIPSPLLLAASQGYLASLNILLEAGVVEEDVERCINVAHAQGNDAVLKILVGDSAQRIFGLQSLLSKKNQNQNATSDSISAIDDVFRTFPWNEMSLLRAMRNTIVDKNVHTLQVLIEVFHVLHQAQSSTSQQLSGILKLAVEHSDMRAVKLLGEAGAELFITFEKELGLHQEEERVSCTLLHLSAYCGNYDMVFDRLSIAPSPTNVGDARSRTPLHYAAAEEDSESVVDLLLGHGATVSTPDDHGYTPLHIAARYGVGKAVASLLKAGADVNAADRSDMTPLHYCAYSFQHNTNLYDSQATRLLLEAGADIDATNREGYTPPQSALIESLRSDKSDYLSSVLSIWPHLISTKAGPLNRTALHFAADFGCGSTILRLLIKTMRADREAEDANGKTALQLSRNEHTRRLLINLGAVWRE